jgi:hypothetical protein
MKIVEYKKHLHGTQIVNPDWIITGNQFFDNSNNTFVGTVLEESERLYYIPEGLVELTMENVKDRAIRLGLNKKLSNPNDPHSSSVQVSEDELVKMISTALNLNGVTDGN